MFGSFLHEWREEIIALGTVVAALFTIVLGIGTVVLARATVNLVRESKKSSERQLRAYVSVEPRGIFPWELEPKITGHIGICNVGRVPARNISYIVEIKWERRDDLDAFDLSDLRKTNAVLQPRAEMRMGSPPILSSTIKGGWRENSYLYVWGRVEYEDGFETKPRFTNFCHRYNCAVIDVEKGLPPESGRYHDNHNQGD
jgi:hypothetical protein